MGVMLVQVSLNSVLASRITFVKLVRTYPGLGKRKEGGHSLEHVYDKEPVRERTRTRCNSLESPWAPIPRRGI